MGVPGPWVDPPLARPPDLRVPADPKEVSERPRRIAEGRDARPRSFSEGGHIDDAVATQARDEQDLSVERRPIERGSPAEILRRLGRIHRAAARRDGQVGTVPEGPQEDVDRLDRSP